MLVLVAEAGALSACGHLPFDDLPAIEDGLSGPDGSSDGQGNGLDGGSSADGSISKDGDVPGLDGGGDAIASDGGVTDATTVDGSVCDECDILHVSIAIGDDKNDGSLKHPLKTIQAAVDKVGPGLREIHVAGGSYNETVTISQRLALKGSYACDATLCDWKKAPDPSTATVLTSKTSFSGSLVFKATVRNSTSVSGLHVVGRAGALDATSATPGGVAVGIYGGTPTLVDMIIDGGSVANGTVTGPGRRSIGLYVEGGTADEQVQVKRTTISGGTSEAASVGVWLDTPIGAALPAKIYVKDSTITAAKANSSVAVVAFASDKSSLFEHDVITSNVSPLANEGESWGVVVDSALRLYRNTINLSPDPTAGPYCSNPKSAPCGGVLATNASLDIESNYIGGVTAAASFAILITATDTKSTDATINGNFLRGGGIGTPVAGSIGAAIGLKLAAGAASHTPGNVRNNILEASASTTRYGVYEVNDAGAKGHLAALSYNDFWNVDVFYSAWDGNSATTYTSSNFANIPVSEHINDINLDPALTADGHLANGSPCISAGIKTSEILSTDIDGQTRPVGSGTDIGPDERED